MTAGGWTAWCEEESARVHTAGRWRAARDLDGTGPETTVHDGRAHPVLSFASNDYLGLTRHPAVVAAAHEALDRWGTGAGSARLVAGSRPLHRQLERELAEWKATEAAVLFASGFAANLGVLQALAVPGVRIVSDALNHASIVDGCRLARGEVVVVPHGDVGAVERAVAAAPDRCLVVTESVFSMDGDLAPLHDLASVCARHGSLLVVDEAHAVMGPEFVAPGPVLRVGTLSKTLASLGGFATGPADLCALLVNRARPFVFTTASSPPDAAAALAALRVVRSPEGEALVARLRANVNRLRPGHPSPILPVLVGNDAAAVAASAALLDLGLLVPAIRPPTVPEGTARLRVSLSAGHTLAQVDRLVTALAALGLDAPAAATAGAAMGMAGAAPAGDAVANAGTTTTGRGMPRPIMPAEGAGQRPERLVMVLGTGTGVGKTWVTAAVASALRAEDRLVSARKPVQSFAPGDGPTDADVLGSSSGECPSDVCLPHRWYEAALAPPLAARALRRPPVRVADLLCEMRWPPGTAVGLVEGVGGPRSPLAEDADNLALAHALRPDVVVLVSEAGLGAINAVLLALDALRRPTLVLLNRFDEADPVHQGNRAWLEERSGHRVVTSVSDLVPLLLA